MREHGFPANLSCIQHLPSLHFSLIVNAVICTNPIRFKLYYCLSGAQSVASMQKVLVSFLAWDHTMNGFVSATTAFLSFDVKPLMADVILISLCISTF